MAHRRDARSPRSKALAATVEMGFRLPGNCYAVLPLALAQGRLILTRRLTGALKLTGGLPRLNDAVFPSVVVLEKPAA